MISSFTFKNLDKLYCTCLSCDLPDRSVLHKQRRGKQKESIESSAKGATGAGFTDQSLLQGHDGAFQLVLHAHDVLRHRVHLELKPGQLSLEILQVRLQHTVTRNIHFISYEKGFEKLLVRKGRSTLHLC